MKILIILTCILVIGGSSTAAVQVLRDFVGSLVWYSIVYEPVKNATLEKCGRNGVSTASDDAIEGFNQFQNSVYPILHEAFEEFALPENLSLNRQEQFAEVCRIIKKLKYSAKLLVESTKPCFNSDERHTIDVTVNVTAALVGYACEDNGSRMLSLYESRSLECVGNYSRRLDACVTGNDKNFLRHLVGFPPTMDLPTFEPNLEICTIGESKQQCFANVLAGCEDKIAPNFINSLLKILMKEVGCEEILKTRPSTSVGQRNGAKA